MFARSKQNVVAFKRCHRAIDDEPVPVVGITPVPVAVRLLQFCSQYRCKSAVDEAGNRTGD